jgi:predicted DNA-binding antitoxin AbrB/MazE fold protein
MEHMKKGDCVKIVIRNKESFLGRSDRYHEEHHRKDVDIRKDIYQEDKR